MKKVYPDTMLQTARPQRAPRFRKVVAGSALLTIMLVSCAFVVRNPAVILPAAAQPAARQLSWQQTGDSVSLVNHGRMVWEHVHDKKVGKPYMRFGLLDGTELTRPWPVPEKYPRNDHVWHRALWWSWKTINGTNYWENNQTGTEPVKVTVETKPDGSARIASSIAYHCSNEPPVVLEELPPGVDAGVEHPAPVELAQDGRDAAGPIAGTITTRASRTATTRPPAGCHSMGQCQTARRPASRSSTIPRTRGIHRCGRHAINIRT